MSVEGSIIQANKPVDLQRLLDMDVDQMFEEVDNDAYRERSMAAATAASELLYELPLREYLNVHGVKYEGGYLKLIQDYLVFADERFIVMDETGPVYRTRIEEIRESEASLGVFARALIEFITNKPTRRI